MLSTQQLAEVVSAVIAILPSQSSSAVVRKCSPSSTVRNPTSPVTIRDGEANANDYQRAKSRSSSNYPAKREGAHYSSSSSAVTERKTMAKWTAEPSRSEDEDSERGGRDDGDGGKNPPSGEDDNASDHEFGGEDRDLAHLFQRRGGRDPAPVVAECKVIKFKKNGPVEIDQWIFQMEYDLQFRQVPTRLWVASLINQVHSKHFKECRAHRHLKYPDFKRKLIELYKRPDMTQAMLQNLLSAAQERDEPLKTFADRVRELVDLAHPKMASNDNASNLNCGFLSRVIR